jgi:hypothetical protein
MNPEDIGPVVLGVVFFVMSGLVLLLRPISTKLGSYLEVLAEQKRRQLSQQPIGRDDTARITTLLETIDQRLGHLEDRQEFTDKLLEGGSRRPDVSV